MSDLSWIFHETRSLCNAAKRLVSPHCTTSVAPILMSMKQTIGKIIKHWMWCIIYSLWMKLTFPCVPDCYFSIGIHSFVMFLTDLRKKKKNQTECKHYLRCFAEANIVSKEWFGTPPKTVPIVLCIVSNLSIYFMEMCLSFFKDADVQKVERNKQMKTIWMTT